MKNGNDLNSIISKSGNSSILYNRIKEYMANRRTCSILNLSEVFDTPLKDIRKVLDSLEKDGLIRISRSGCSGSCGTCASDCSEDAADETAVVISLQKKESDDDS